MFRVTKVPPGRYEPLAALRFGAWPGSTAVGSTSGPDPVLLVHGQPGRASVWRQVGDEPARRGVHALALDRPGYGRSHRPAVGFAGNAVAVVDFLDHHGIDRVTVVAHNLASGAAIALAIAFPERVTSMVLLAPVGATSSVNRLGRLLAWPIIGWGALRGGLRPGGLADGPRSHPTLAAGRLRRSRADGGQADSRPCSIPGGSPQRCGRAAGPRRRAPGAARLAASSRCADVGDGRQP